LVARVTEVNENGRENSHNSEEDEIRKRKNNIVMYSVPELASNDVMERR